MAKVEIYKDRAGEYRWRARARNGRIVADSGEGYGRRRDCLRGIEATFRALLAANNTPPPCEGPAKKARKAAKR